MKDDRVKDQYWWEEYFSVGGGWEKNHGRDQSRIFSEHFTDRVEIDASASISILDVGCALGDAIRNFSIRFPNAKLYGVDFSDVAIKRCKSELADIAHFEVADISGIAGHYDLIYCSNTLEHFADFDLKARKLSKHCSRLCIMVPYKELRAGFPLKPHPSEHHQHTFLQDSFDFLIHDGIATEIRTVIFTCPGAWWWDPKEKIRQRIKNFIRPLIGRKKVEEPRQILFDIRICS